MAASIPGGQLGRYLLVGIWNTLFGYLAFAGLTAVLSGIIPYSYVAAALLSNLVSITVAFLAYKWFVFRTKGNYWQEWSRCVTVYTGSILCGLALLPVLVFVLSRLFGSPRTAPYIAGAILTCLTPIISFIGHKNFSFRACPESHGASSAPNALISEPGNGRTP